jgi:hypothetical protein
MTPAIQCSECGGEVRIEELMSMPPVAIFKCLGCGRAKSERPVYTSVVDMSHPSIVVGDAGPKRGAKQ